MGLTNTPSDLLSGTLELLILKALASGSVGERALYPALQRILLHGWAKAVTTSGRRQLAAEEAEFDRFVGAIQRVLLTS